MSIPFRPWTRIQFHQFVMTVCSNKVQTQVLSRNRPSQSEAFTSDRFWFLFSPDSISYLQYGSRQPIRYSAVQIAISRRKGMSANMIMSSYIQHYLNRFDQIREMQEGIRSAVIPDNLDDEDIGAGLRMSDYRTLLQYWKHKYSWTDEQNALNQFSQFTTEIQGINLHFIHDRSRHGIESWPICISRSMRWRITNWFR